MGTSSNGNWEVLRCDGGSDYGLIWRRRLNHEVRVSVPALVCFHLALLTGKEGQHRM